jgi:hypothetical protein
VKTISSVSGGSITNALVAQECDFSTVTSYEFDSVARKLATAIVTRGLLDATLFARLFVVTLIGLAILGVWSLSRWSTHLVPWWLCMVFLGAFGVLAALRGTLVEYLFGTVLFRKSGRSTTLGDVKGGTEHVFCATDLNHAGPWHFVAGSRAFSYSPARDLRGVVDTAEIRLQTVVRASAAFPGAFPPKRMHFGSKRAFLADGGVWNNLGTQWWGLDSTPFERDRQAYLPNRSFVDRLLIVDAGLFLKPTAGIWFSLPFVGELLLLARAISVLYPNSVRPRVEALRASLDRWVDDEKMPLGPAVVTLSDSLGTFSTRHCVEAAIAYGERVRDLQRGLTLDQVESADSGQPRTRRQSMNRRALAFLESLAAWRRAASFLGFESLVKLHELARAVPTTLSRVDRSDALALLAYGYLSSMEALHVTFDAPMLTPPDGRRLLHLIGVLDDPYSMPEMGIATAPTSNAPDRNYDVL